LNQNALQYARFRYLWVALGLLTLSSGLYWLQDSTTPPSGGTWQGLTLGIVAGLLIFWLNYLGVRKRRYGKSGSLQGWVSAHVYLGTALVGISLFHSAGQLGWNVHSLFFWLMIAVIVSGMFGIFGYLSLPRRLSSIRNTRSRAEIIEELTKLEHACLERAAACSENVGMAVRTALEQTRIGGSVSRQLLGRVPTKHANPRCQRDDGSAPFVVFDGASTGLASQTKTRRADTRAFASLAVRARAACHSGVVCSSHSRSCRVLVLVSLWIC